ncbi:hypothetical protein [Actinomadura madurae]|uniref:hypothetical protein n=1 Tax=Actinomadura madurae TaxID=1993 RepID=UPI002026E4AD|nr:hypothetical protein [Actinomadura madurae]MCP9953145.1 hypothetical protein [Actinomadura madurae]MCP9969910.1 hypothetical protein [Actinomadura madurae]MCP9982358.1 hypothetical protein [Actinomadura madurae]MCQ0006111.1 hypothetical protein [Actinomadura madurae]MCQ0018607.1 hypothetical protein [Actinomadura madurae]
MDDVRTPELRLAALAAHLSARKLDVGLDSGGLRVRKPQAKGNAEDTISCRVRPEDGGRLWYFTSGGEPIAPADRVTDAAVFVLGHLAGESR